MNNARRVNPATPLRRLSTRAIHAVVGVPVAFLVFAVPALVGVFLGVLLYGDGLLWAQRIVAIVLISATWAIYVSAWVFVLRRAQINGWQLCAIFTPAIVLLVMSAIFLFLWFDPLPYLLSAASYVSIWTIGSLFLLSHGQTVSEALSGILAVSPNPPKGYGGGVDTGDDGYGKANGPGPVPIDGVEGSGRWPRQWPGGGRQWRRPAKTARRHAGSGTGGLGWHEFAGQPLGLSGGRVGRRRRAVRLAGEWRAIGPGRN